MLIRKFILLKNLSIFFLPKSSCLFLKSPFGVVYLRLPSIYFYESDFKSYFSFSFLSKFNFISVLSHLKVLINRLSIIYFLRLKIKGLGYRVKRICKFLYRFYFTATCYIYFHVPKDVLVKARKRRLILLSNNLQLLRSVFVHILLLKRLSPYNKRGIFYPRQIIFLKKGKKIV